MSRSCRAVVVVVVVIVVVAVVVVVVVDDEVVELGRIATWAQSVHLQGSSSSVFVMAGGGN